MRYIFVLIISLGLLNAQELSPEQTAKLQNYNHSLSGKLRHKRLMKRIANITEADIKQRYRGENVYSIKLSYHNRRLFYKIQTKNGTIKIDALDGSIMGRR